MAEEQGTHPQSPFDSVKMFKELKLEAQLLKGINDMDFQHLLRIQKDVLLQLLANPPRNIIVQSQNGTGKKVIFSVAILSRIDPQLNYVQALILSPTSELALQIGKLIENMAKFLPHIKIAYAVRDLTISKRRQYIKGKELNIPIVIGTPGTVEDWCRKMKIIDLRKIRMFVIAEADVMINTPDYSQICTDLVRNRIGKDCQTMLFSTTDSDKTMHFAKQIIENPHITVQLKPEEQSVSNTNHFYIEYNQDEDKYYAVKTAFSYVEEVGSRFGQYQSMIFCRYKRSANALASQMRKDEYSLEVLSSELSLEERAAVMSRFRNGEFRILVATNVYARGIDIDNISLVLNFDFPLIYDDLKRCFIDEPDYDTYLHRIRIVERSDRIGHTFNLILPREERLLNLVENYFQKSMKKIPIKYTADDERYTSETTTSTLANSSQIAQVSSTRSNPGSISSLAPSENVTGGPPSTNSGSPFSTSFSQTSISGSTLHRGDPNSPFYSMRTFQELNLEPDLLKGIFDMGFLYLSKIQAITLPHLLCNRSENIIAQSQSGTGKTVAFSLAILSRIDRFNRSPQALILVPTLELARQIGSVIEKMAQFLPYIKIAYAVTDSDISKRPIPRQLLREPIVIGTPGTVDNWYNRLRVIDLRKLRICCIDEADYIIANEDFRQIYFAITNRLDHSKCQIMLFSATYSDKTMEFARLAVPAPFFVWRLLREQQMLVNIRQFFTRCYDQGKKYDAIKQMYASLTIGQTIIFCQTKATALNLAIQLQRENHSVQEIMSILDAEQRKKAIREFRDGVFRVLIATNLAARGLDINDVTLVINYDMPVTETSRPDYEIYLHRIGRCGRFGKLGYIFNLIDPNKDFQIMKSIEEYYNHPIEEITIEKISQLEEIE